MKQKEKDDLILDWITKAKECYTTGCFCLGMCGAFKISVIMHPFLKDKLIGILQNMGYNYMEYNYKWPHILIPEFNYDFLSGEITTAYNEELKERDIISEGIYWWDIRDSKSRFKAFNILRNIYEAKVNEKPL